ncbi:thioredoxin family protein [Autumnicola edwardsiae]|uniref:Thioredoxin domain-containing protein n=1 Tax=Autumnicola edwardsiae TaxID=3075594 RepID=A0ABU3CRC0_9FLAO|nr:thioredoxin domain-containing protein [Zunongwangia sp. F297]MDT0648887.1 thioredoxin domain-containing protein [Zunongwangia sp. F297]
MKKITFLVLIFFSFNSYAANWLTSLEDAKKLALGTNKFIIVDFWATWCGPCRMMDAESWKDPEIEALMQNFVPVKIDIDQESGLANEYNVRAIPDVFILNGNGDVVFHKKGYMSKAEVARLLKDYSLQTSFVQMESIAYFKSQKYHTALRLARKYQDFSLYLEEDVRENVLRVSEKYLKDASKLLDKKQSNYDWVNQQIELLELVPILYSGDYDKVARKMARNFNLEEINDKNLSLYYYLNYCCSRGMDVAGKSEWKESLSTYDTSDEFTQKAKILFGEI